jgi:hypothetical protein
LKKGIFISLKGKESRDEYLFKVLKKLEAVLGKQSETVSNAAPVSKNYPESRPEKNTKIFMLLSEQFLHFVSVFIESS